MFGGKARQRDVARVVAPAHAARIRVARQQRHMRCARSIRVLTRLYVLT